MIKILGVGPGTTEYLTFQAMRELEENKNIVLKTGKHSIAEYLRNKGIEFKTYDNIYKENLEEFIDYIAEDLIEKHKKCNNIVYVVPGHPLIGEKSVTRLIALCKSNNINYKFIPTMSFIDILMERMELDLAEGLTIVDAFDIKNQIFNKRIGTVVTQIYDGFIASEVKLKLLDFYNGETEIVYIKNLGIEEKECIRKIKLYELDCQQDIDCLTIIYIPKDVNNKKDFNDLLDIIDTLRSEDGCPWDREQTHESMRKAMIEEAYEVVDAIDRNDYDGMIEELGDVLFQVIFHSAMGKSEECFDIWDVIEGICAKMIYRHPHVFGDKKSIANSDTVLKKWEELKKKEKGYSDFIDELNGIAKGLPATLRAHKVQKKAREIGFDFKNINQAVDKLKEEINEVLDVYNMGKMDKIEDEVGDLLFSGVNIARLLKVDEELALNKTTDKFIKRMIYISKAAKEQGKKLEELNLDEMNKLWETSKNKVIL